MQDRLETFGGSGDPLVFAHANGYPPGSYRQLLELLSAQSHVTAVRHRPLWGEPQPPSRLRWQMFADDLIDTLKATQEAPVWLLGHSLGAVVGLLAAAREPALFRGLMLLDPVFLPTRFVIAMALTPRSRLRRMPMIRRALSRPATFTDAQAAFEFYRGKRAFSGLDDDALRDYVAASTGCGWQRHKTAVSASLGSRHLRLHSMDLAGAETCLHAGTGPARYRLPDTVSGSASALGADTEAG